jgi:hypothetical protein
MKELFTYCFDKWWRPIIFFGLTVGLYVIGELIKKPLIQNIFFFLFGIGLLGLLVSTIYHFIKKHWPLAILTAAIIGVSLLGFFLYSISMFWKIQSEPDKYADNLKIPTNIQINQPLEQVEPERINDTDFYLYNSFQPGLYIYAFWTKRIEKGEIYLKAFEITNNDQLSANRLKESSLIQVYNPKDTIVKFQLEKENSEFARPFTIYEGDWGNPYAARFEVWFKPEKNGKERKLIEKNYKIEGWQR